MSKYLVSNQILGMWQNRLAVLALNIIIKSTFSFCWKGKKIIDILNAPVWSDTCLSVSWKRSFESYIHGFHLNYAAIFYYYYCPRFCLMKISLIKSSAVFHNCKYDDHHQKDDNNQGHDGFYFASAPPHLPSELFGSVAKSSCVIR